MLRLFAWSGASRRGSTDLQDWGSETRVPPLRNRVWVQLSLALVGNLMVIIWLGTVHAASPFNVNSASDEPDSNLGDGICETASGTCTLRAAIQEANEVGIKAHPGTLTGPNSCSMPSPVSPPQQTINLPSGTYQLAAPPPGMSAAGEDDAATGDLDIKANLQINGAGEDSTTIDANNVDRAFDICKGWTVQITGVTIKNGRITLASEAGGGVQNRGQLTLDSVRVSNNQSGIAAGMSFYLSAGGIYNDRGATLTLLKAVVSDNQANGMDGGILNSGSLTVSDTTISNNQTMATQSQTRDEGGGITNTSGGSAEIIRSTINGNRAWRGAGIYLDSGTMTITNTTISGNVADREGGAIYASGSFSMANSTVADNSSGGTGEHIYMLSGIATFTATIIAQGALGCGQQSPSSFRSLGFNIDQGASCGFTTPLTLCSPGPGISWGDQQNTNPQLGSLANNGGFTQTHALMSSSPAIDQVPAFLAPPTDQRGIGRPQYPSCSHPPCLYAACSPWADVGAYELVQPNVPVLILRDLKPRSIEIASEKLILRVEGEGFLSGAIIYWNWTPLPTEVRDSTHAEAAVTPEMFPRCGNYSITAKNPRSDPSSPLAFLVDGCDHLLHVKSGGK